MADLFQDFQTEALQAGDAEKLVRAIREKRADQVQATILGFGENAERFLNTPFAVNQGNRTTFLIEAMNADDELTVRALLKAGAHPETRTHGKSGQNAFYTTGASPELLSTLVDDIRRRYGGDQADMVVHEAIVGGKEQETDSPLFLHADARNDEQVLKLLDLLPNGSSKRQALEQYVSPLGYELDMVAERAGKTLNPQRTVNLRRFYYYDDLHNKTQMERKLESLHYDVDHYDDSDFYYRPRSQGRYDTEVHRNEREQLMREAPTTGGQRRSIADLKAWLEEEETEQPILPPPMADRFLKLLPDLTLPKQEREIEAAPLPEEVETIFPDDIDVAGMRAALKDMGKKKAAKFLNTPVQREDGSRTMFLLEAMNTRNKDLIELFLEYGADPNTRAYGDFGPNAFYANGCEVSHAELITGKKEKPKKSVGNGGLAGEFARASGDESANYRTREFEQALADYEREKTGQSHYWETRDILMNRALKGGVSALKDLDEFLDKKIGRKLDADDFCLLVPGDFRTTRGCSSLTFGDSGEGIGAIVEFLLEKKSVFSAQALLIGAQWSNIRDESALHRAEERGWLNNLFDAKLWQIDPAPLQELRGQVNNRIRRAIDECLHSIDQLQRRAGKEAEAKGLPENTPAVLDNAKLQVFLDPSAAIEETPETDIDPIEQKRQQALEALTATLEGFGDGAADLINTPVEKPDGSRVMLLTEIMNTRNPAAIALFLKHGADPTKRAEGKKGQNAFYATDSEPEHMVMLTDHIRATHEDPDMAIHKAIVGGMGQKTDPCLFAHADKMNGHHIKQLLSLLPNDSSKAQALDISISPRHYQIDKDAQRQDTYFSITRCMQLREFLSWRSRFSSGEMSRWMDQLSDELYSMRRRVDRDDRRFYYNPQSDGDAQIRQSSREREEAHYKEIHEKEVRQQAEYREKIRAEIEARTEIEEQMKAAAEVIEAERENVRTLSAELQDLEQTVETNGLTITSLMERRQQMRDRLQALRQPSMVAAPG